MAKAQFHKNQRVYVRSVGTWALIERVIPHWAKDVEEPIRIHYDVGLGREFGAHELEAEETAATTSDENGPSEDWRVIRAPNKWKTEEESAHHPYPGSYPVIVTNPRDWGGWRVPGSEYDYDPRKIESQARVMANSLRMLHVMKRLVEYGDAFPENMSNELFAIASDARTIIKTVDSPGGS